MITVLGDLFTDQYFIGHTRGMSAEATIPIVDTDEVRRLAGGAGNVVMNLVSMGERDVRYVVRPEQNYPTKNRLVVGDTQLARWDEDDYCYPYDVSDLVGIEHSSIIICCDYGKGSISKEVIQHLRRMAERGIVVLVDTKGDPTPWVGSEAVLFPNKSEYERYREPYQWIHNVVLKQSSEGLALMEFGNVVLTRPATADYVRSVNGAGDTVVAAWAVATSMRFSYITQMLEFCNAAAACAVEKPFTAVVTLEEIEDKLGKVVGREEKNHSDRGAANPRRSTVSRYGLFDLCHTPFEE